MRDEGLDGASIFDGIVEKKIVDRDALLAFFCVNWVATCCVTCVKVKYFGCWASVVSAHSTHSIVVVGSERRMMFKSPQPFLCV